VGTVCIDFRELLELDGFCAYSIKGRNRSRPPLGKDAAGQDFLLLRSIAVFWEGDEPKAA